MTQINYYLRPTIDTENSLNSFNKILEYFMSFVGDIEVKKETEESAIIYYLGTPTLAFLKLEKTGQVTVTISNNDNVTINLIKNIAQGLGLRVYNPQINAYLPNDVNVFDLSTVKIDTNVKNLINQYHLTPLFQLRNSMVFFCKATDESIHVVNRHLLEYLISDPTPKIYKSEFSSKVADNISQFIALYDRGLISLTNFNSKIINLSGFDLDDLPKDTKLNIIKFGLDVENQKFIQQDTLEEIPEKYLALKIGQDYTYSIVDKKLTKILNVSTFCEI